MICVKIKIRHFLRHFFKRTLFSYQKRSKRMFDIDVGSSLGRTKTYGLFNKCLGYVFVINQIVPGDGRFGYYFGFFYPLQCH